jgi:predicted TIM-barrel fold metal-dependent hydrolase
MAHDTFKSRSNPNNKVGPRPRGAFVFALLLVLAGSMWSGPIAGNPPSANSTSPAAAKGVFSPAELKAFAKLHAIDTHAHIFVTDPAFTAMLKRLNLHVLDICVAGSVAAGKNLSHEISEAENFVKSSDGHGALCTTFNPYPVLQPDFAQAAIRQINQNFDEGAIAVKIWKNVGMEIKDAQGHYIMPDNPVFEPIYHDIAAHGKTLVAHLAEPDSCWKPPDPASPDYSYYKEHPEWYMYGKPGAPTKEEILNARDHVVAENPNLRVVGAHLGSMESNFDELGRRFDRYPNFAVDMAARMPYVMMAGRDRAIAFITKYQDRLIYGTDLDYRPGAESKETLEEWEKYYARDWRFLATKDWVEYMGKKYQGLELPQPILEKIYHSNAVHWFPGILGK